MNRIVSATTLIQCMMRTGKRMPVVQRTRGRDGAGGGRSRIVHHVIAAQRRPRDAPVICRARPRTSYAVRSRPISPRTASASSAAAVSAAPA